MLHTPVVTPVMIGRRTELEALQAMMREAERGRGGLVVIGGDAGVGKTRLCHELKASAAQRQVRVIEGRSSRAEANVPYGPFMDALRFRLARGESETAAQVLEPILARIAPLFSGLAEPAEAAREPADTAVPFEPILRVLQRLAALGPVLFILEDIHWADSTSRDLLHYLARRISTLRMLVVATYRTDEIHDAHPVHRLVSTLARERTALRVQLDPLEQSDVDEMLRVLLSVPPERGFADAVFQRTEGNPLFIEELVAVLREAVPEHAPQFRATDLARVTAPATLHEAVWERLGPLSDNARQALTVAAVIGRRFQFDVLGATLDWPEERLLHVIEQLVANRILVEAPEAAGEVYLFRHSLVQEVLYSSIIGRRRRQWHRRVAAALERLGGTFGMPHTTLAHHYSLGGEPYKARLHTVLAGDEAARLCAWRDAEAMYEDALAALEREGGDPATEADILERMTEVAWWQNRISALAQYASDALEIRRSLGDQARAAMLLRKLANLDAYQRGDTAGAAQRLQEALQLVARDSAESAFLLNDLGRLQLMRGAYDDAAKLFEQSLAISAGRGDCAEEALSLVLLGWLAVHRTELSAGVSRLELARALLSEESLPVERGAEVFHAGVRALDAAREHQRAREWVQAALEYATEHGARGDQAIFRAYQAAAQRRAGNWEEALRAADAAVAELRASGRAELREALRILGDLRRSRGDLAAARVSYEEALDLGESDAAIGAALVLFAEQNWGDAVKRLSAALEVQPAADRLFAMRVLPILIEALVAHGSLADARVRLSALSELVGTSDYRPGTAVLAQARGIVHAAAGEFVKAAHELRNATDRWSELELPYEAARAKLLLAEQLMRTPRTRAEAVQLAGESARSLEEMGATIDVSRAHHLLRRAGVRRRRLTRTDAALPQPLARLTQREREVLFEIARGRTNKQIARTLSMSSRTVDNHVSAILSKLECATRTEAARVALIVSPHH